MDGVLVEDVTENKPENNYREVAPDVFCMVYLNVEGRTFLPVYFGV